MDGDEQHGLGAPGCAPSLEALEDVPAVAPPRTPELRKRRPACWEPAQKKKRKKEQTLQPVHPTRFIRRSPPRKPGCSDPPPPPAALPDPRPLPQKKRRAAPRCFPPPPPRVPQKDIRLLSPSQEKRVPPPPPTPPLTPTSPKVYPYRVLLCTSKEVKVKVKGDDAPPPLPTGWYFFLLQKRVSPLVFSLPSLFFN